MPTLCTRELVPAPRPQRFTHLHQGTLEGLEKQMDGARAGTRVAACQLCDRLSDRVGAVERDCKRALESVRSLSHRVEDVATDCTQAQLRVNALARSTAVQVPQGSGEGYGGASGGSSRVTVVAHEAAHGSGPQVAGTGAGTGCVVGVDPPSTSGGTTRCSVSCAGPGGRVHMSFGAPAAAFAPGTVTQAVGPGAPGGGRLGQGPVPGAYGPTYPHAPTTAPVTQFQEGGSGGGGGRRFEDIKRRVESSIHQEVQQRLAHSGR